MYPYNPYINQQPYGYGQMRQPLSMPVASIPGEMVGDIETVRAAQIDMSGQPRFYPRSDGSAIYRKQLMPDGTSKIMTYNLATEPQESASDTSTDSQIASALAEITQRLDTLSEQVKAINSLWGGTSNE